MAKTEKEKGKQVACRENKNTRASKDTQDDDG